MFRNNTALRVSAAALIAAGTGLASLAAATPAATAKESIYVTVDRAKVMRIAEPASTVIIGNPAVADAVMHNQNTLVIVGRRFGATNLIILDEDSQPIADEIIVVRPADSTVVTVQRQAARFSYSCSPTCSPSPVPGDQDEYFKTNSSQESDRNEVAEAAAK